MHPVFGVEVFARCSDQFAIGWVIHGLNSPDIFGDGWKVLGQEAGQVSFGAPRPSDYDGTR